MLRQKKIKLLKQAKKLYSKKQYVEAISIYEKICSAEKNDFNAWQGLGDIYWSLQQYQNAADCYQKVVALKPKEAAAFSQLAMANHALGDFSKALENFELSLELDSTVAATYFNLGNLYRDQRLADSAETSYRKSLQLDPNQPRALSHLGNLLRERCLIDDALDCYEKALLLDPDDSEAKWSKLRLLPTIIESSEQLKAYRQRYKVGLQYLEESLSLNSTEKVLATLKGILNTSGFLLQYQGKNDLELQTMFGRLVYKTMASHFPQWSKPVSMKPLNTGERIRIGFASSFLCNHNGANWLVGWLRQFDKSRFEIFCYHTGDKLDNTSHQFKKYSDHFYHLPNDLKRPCEKIVSDKLHILIYPELGMYAPTQLMASMYLAPIQCTSWGHPVTSGFAALDYWLSSDLMEPENGQQHYLEKLIRIPNIMISYSQDQSDTISNSTLDKARGDFGLREDSVLYFCSQSLFKYLPEYDFLYAAIAKEVPNAQFAFITVFNEDVATVFKQRLTIAFSKVGLDVNDYCEILPRLVQDDFIIMNRLADVFLDNPSWSGANTTLTAVDCNLPIVTLPTEFMRGRHSYAILKNMDIADTIASNTSDYITLAVRLGVDTNWRSEMVEKIKRSKRKLYNDNSNIRGLETFFMQAVKDKVSASKTS